MLRPKWPRNQPVSMQSRGSSLLANPRNQPLLHISNDVAIRRRLFPDDKFGKRTSTRLEGAYRTATPSGLKANKDNYPGSFDPGLTLRDPAGVEARVADPGTSNFDFHYMGSAKIMAQIGKGFAEAMAGLVRGR